MKKEVRRIISFMLIIGMLISISTQVTASYIQTNSTGNVEIPNTSIFAKTINYGTWEKQINGKWKYKYLGSYIKNEFVEINSKFYFFDSQGYMVANKWGSQSGYQYAYFGPDGSEVSGWAKIDSNWYYFDDYYDRGYVKAINTYIFENSYTYYIDYDGTMAQNKWINHKYYYLDPDWWNYYDAYGHEVVGWQKINNIWYYFDPYYDGRMAQDTEVFYNNHYYYLDNNGAMVKNGWRNLYSERYPDWHYFGSTGSDVWGWQKINNKWYYFLENSGVNNGHMTTGWNAIGGKWYYMNSSGVMTTGWQKVGTSWYYMDSSGAMQTGWLKLGNYWYYLESSGKMVSNCTKTINGKTYRFDSNGHML